MSAVRHYRTADAQAVSGPAPMRLDLPARDGTAATTATRLVALLDGAVAGDWILSATPARAEPGDVWLAAPDAPMVAVRAVDGAAVTLHGDRVDAVAAAVDAVAPLLDAIEAQTGWRYEFDAAPAARDPAGAVVVVEGGGHGLALAIDPGCAIPLADTALDTRPNAGRVNAARGVVPLSLTLAGPALSIAVAGGIMPGDLLVLGGGPWRSTLDAAGLYQQVGHYTPTGHWTMHDPHADDEAAAGAPEGIAAFAVPVSVHLPDTSMPLGTLSALTPGSVLPVVPLTAGLRVDLRVAGRVIAWGEVVRLGDHFAVAVDRVPGPADADGAL